MSILCNPIFFILYHVVSIFTFLLTINFVNFVILTLFIVTYFIILFSIVLLLGQPVGQ